MTTKLAHFSVVVAGASHNPTLLNPDFLRIHEIVPAEWGWELSPNPITTPPLSQVRYTNGLAITLEHDKLQVMDPNVGEDPTNSKAPRIAGEFVATLPHVRYTAVGHNFLTLVELQNPASELKNRFVKNGPWDADPHTLSGVGLRLVYALPNGNGRVVLSLDEGTADLNNDGGGGESQVLVINGNFHRDCTEYPAEKQVAERLSHVSDDWEMFQQLLERAISHASAN